MRNIRIKKKNSLEFILDDKFNVIKNDIINFLKTHYNKYTVNDNLNKYLTNMDNICKNTEAFSKEKLKDLKKMELNWKKIKRRKKNVIKKKIKKGNKKLLKKIVRKKRKKGK